MRSAAVSLASPGGVCKWSVVTGATPEGSSVGNSFTIWVSDPGRVVVRVQYSTRVGENQCAGYEVCEFYAVRVKRKSVEFGGAKHPINPDPGSTVQSFTPPEWLDSNEDGDPTDAADGDHLYPVVYTLGDMLTVQEVEFKLEGDTPPGAQLRVKASATIHGQSGTSEVDATRSGNKIRAQSVQLVTLPQQVRIVEHSTINWSLGVEDATGSVAHWEPLGATTQRRIYLTLGTPQGGRLETYYHIGCTGATGTADEGSTFLGLWSQFASLNVQTVGGQQLKYYTSACNIETPNYVDAVTLVANGVGRCGAWQGLLIEVANAQGIAGALARDIIPNPAANVLPAPCVGAPVCAFAHPDPFLIWMMINTYNFGTSTDPCSDYPHRVNHACVGVGANWPQPDTTDGNGVAGQSNGNPPGMFLDHAIVQYNGELYDPSYGTGPFADLAAYEAASIAGFAIPQQFNPGIPGTQLGCYFRCRKNTAGQQLTFRP